MDNSNLHVPVRELERRFRSTIIRLPALAGNEVINFSLGNFKRLGFLGSSFVQWKKRKSGWKKKSNREGRDILVDKGRLRRSGRIVSATFERVVVGFNVPYAKAHNEGLQIGVIQSVKSFRRKSGAVVKSHSRRVNMKISRSQFIGNSPYLTARIRRMASVHLIRATKY